MAERPSGEPVASTPRRDDEFVHHRSDLLAVMSRYSPSPFSAAWDFALIGQEDLDEPLGVPQQSTAGLPGAAR